MDFMKNELERCFNQKDLLGMKNLKLLKNFKGIIFDIDEGDKLKFIENGKETQGGSIVELTELPEYFENDENFF